jgi:hypothetical protein
MLWVYDQIEVNFRINTFKKCRHIQKKETINCNKSTKKQIISIEIKIRLN